jgi:hypothetical protein
VTDITPKREREAWRGVVVKTQSWSEIVAVWTDLAEAMPKLTPLHNFVSDLAASPAASVLFAATLKHGDGPGIAFSDSPDFRSTDGVLEVRYFLGGEHFEFKHRTFSGHDDHKIVQASEAIETLRLFLRYKFGILLEGPAA